mgnify:CR=1 FL=1
MIELLLYRDDLKYYITEEYTLQLDRDWLVDYIKNSTEYANIDEFLEFYNSEDTEEIISTLDDIDEPYTLEKTGRYCDCDDLLWKSKK